MRDWDGEKGGGRGWDHDEAGRRFAGGGTGRAGAQAGTLTLPFSDYTNKLIKDTGTFRSAVACTLPLLPPSLLRTNPSSFLAQRCSRRKLNSVPPLLPSSSPS